MSARATIPVLAESAITSLFETSIAATRIFWTQRADGTLVCVDWDWCCPEIPAVLGGLEVVVFVTRGPSRAEVVGGEVIVVGLDERRVWGCFGRVLPLLPRAARAITWDDRVEVEI
jgi:hypothetical protein